MNENTPFFRIESNTSAGAIADVIERSLVEYQVKVAQVMPDGRWSADGSVTWIDTGVPFTFYNGVYHSHMDKNETDAVIDRIKGRFAGKEPAFTWQIGPSSRPLDLAEFLLRHGFIHVETEPGMAVDLTEFSAKPTVPGNIEIRPVRTQAGIRHWIDAWAYGEPKSYLPIFTGIHGQMPLDDDSPWQYLVAWQEDRPVATTLLYLGGEAAVIHWVATIPAVRRQGIGAAITAAALGEARTRNYQTAVLTSSAEGFRVYQRLGFKQYCEISKYRYSCKH